MSINTTGEVVPGGWDRRILKQCLEKLKSGKYVERGWSPQCLSHPAENTWGVLKTTSVQMGEYLPEYNKELPKTLEPKVGLEVNDGDFLVTTTGPRNRCGVVCHVKTTPKKLIFSGKILRFRADENQVLASWVMYLLMSPSYQKVLDQLKVGTSDSSVSIGNQQILDLEIPVASIDEQKKIVEILDEQLSRLDAALASVRAVREKSARFRRSLLHAAFTGVLTAIDAENSNTDVRVSVFEDLFDLVSNERRQVKQRDYKSSGRFPVVDQGEEIVGGFIDDGDLLFDGALPVIVFGDHTRRLKFIDFPFVVGADGTKLIQCKEAVLPRYGFYHLEAAEFRNRGYARHFAELKKVMFWLPSIRHQEKIIEMLEEQFSRLEASLAVADAIEKEASALRRSLLHAAFNGNLTKEWREGAHV